MEENFTLTPEILGPIIKNAYWDGISGPPWEADKDFVRLARMVLEKLKQTVAHKKHHNCVSNLGDHPTHYTK